MTADEIRELRINSLTKSVEAKIEQAAKQGHEEVEVGELLPEIREHLREKGFKVDHHEVPYDPDATPWTSISWKKNNKYDTNSLY